jgi:hypothetical protein
MAKPQPGAPENSVKLDPEHVRVGIKAPVDLSDAHQIAELFGLNRH